MLDAEQRPLTHFWLSVQQTVLLQQVWVGAQLVVPQQVCAAATQNFVALVLQQLCPAAHEVLPQQKPAETEQKVPPLLFVQQVWAAAHEMLPQQMPADTEQNFPPLLFVQQVSAAAHEVVPQQVVPAAMQKFPVQQVWPALQAGVQVAALARRVHRLPITVPKSKPVIRLNACRRGIGLANKRAASSNR